jgi:hydantoinase/carbamoylase family amidase
MSRTAELEMLEERFAQLAAIGQGEDDSVSRLAYTQLERDAHAQFATWVQAAGGRSERDLAGNTVGILSEGTPYLLLGSHLDSVPHGGQWDGTVGVVAGFEAARRLAEVGPVRVIAFAAEEGARFGRPCLGSSLAVGALSAHAAAQLADAAGVSFYEAAADVGLSPGSLEPWIDEQSVLAYLEVHIEQGRVLEESETMLGIVDAIAGSCRLRVTVTGVAEHSGATPMELRHDALTAAAEVVLAAEAMAHRYAGDLRATVGRLVVDPGSITTIPGEVVLTIDLRDTDSDRQRRATAEIRKLATEIAQRRAVGIQISELSFVGAVLLSAWARRALQQAAEERGIKYRIMPSGAGHDAGLVALSAPAALLFIACAGGRSHVPDERCSVDDVLVALDVMVDAGKRLFEDRRRALGTPA